MLAKQTHKLLVLVLLVIGLGLVACGTPADTAVEAQSLESGGQITVVGNGEAQGAPDQAQVQVGVETFAAIVSDATNENEAVIQQIIAAMDELGIAAEDMQTTNYNLWAEQNYGDNGPEGINGYRVNNQINVTIRDIDQIGEVIAAATNAGANSIYGIHFTVSDPAALQEEARAAAMADARARAESLAGLSGQELAGLQYISEIIGQTPMPLMRQDMAFAETASLAPSISPGELSVNMQVQVTFTTK